MAEQQTKKRPNKGVSNATVKGPAATNGTSIDGSGNSAVIKNSSNETKSHNRKKINGMDSSNKEVNMLASAANANATTTSKQSSKPAKKINKTSEMLEKVSTNTVNAKLDDVLKTVRQLDNTCDFGRCRTKTSLIGQDCTLCQQRFCMKHQLPEIHGCGGAVKKEQRTEFLKPRPTLPISAALRRNEQKDAHSRLEQKLKEMSMARQKARK